MVTRERAAQRRPVPRLARGTLLSRTHYAEPLAQANDDSAFHNNENYIK